MNVPLQKPSEAKEGQRASSQNHSRHFICALKSDGTRYWKVDRSTASTEPPKKSKSKSNYQPNTSSSVQMDYRYTEDNPVFPSSIVVTMDEQNVLQSSAPDVKFQRFRKSIHSMVTRMIRPAPEQCTKEQLQFLNMARQAKRMDDDGDIVM